MKKLLIGLGAVVALVIVAAIAAPFFIPIDAYKDQLVALVKGATGRDLRIAGPIKFSLFPSIALEAGDVSFSNAPGGSAKNMAEIKTLEIELKLFPLLHGAVEIARFRLADPAIALEVDKEGHPNWVFTKAPAPPGASPAQSSAARPAGGGSTLAGLNLDDLRLVDGAVSYFDARSGKKYALSDIDMQMSLPSLSGPFTAQGSAVWNGEKVTLTANIAKPGALQDGAASAVAIELGANPINFDFQGEAVGATLAKLNGAIDLAIPSVRGLAKWAGEPIDMAGNGFGPLAIKGKISTAGQKYEFTDAQISFDAIKGTGGIVLDLGGARPYAKGGLALDKLDVNPYLPAETAAPPAKGAAPAPNSASPAAGPASSAGWSDAPIDLAGLKIADLDFDLSANAIQYRKITIGKSGLGLHLKNGRLEADLSQIELYQGKGSGKVVADGSGAVPAIAADFNLANVQIEPLFRDAAGFDRVTGAGGFQIEVTGHGSSQRAIIGSLDGKGALNLANGKIKGVNLVAMLKNVAASFTGQSGANETDFGALTGTYTIASGILRNDDLKLVSPQIPMTGKGTVDLPQRTVDYRLQPSLAGIVAVPVLIEGPWDNLSYRPDLAGIAQGLAKDPGKALDALKNAAPGGGTKPSDLLKGLFGK